MRSCSACHRNCSHHPTSSPPTPWKVLGVKSWAPLEWHFCDAPGCGGYLFEQLPRSDWPHHQDQACPQCRTPRFKRVLRGGRSCLEPRAMFIGFPPQVRLGPSAEVPACSEHACTQQASVARMQESHAMVTAAAPATALPTQLSGPRTCSSRSSPIPPSLTRGELRGRRLLTCRQRAPGLRVRLREREGEPKVCGLLASARLPAATPAATPAAAPAQALACHHSPIPATCRSAVQAHAGHGWLRLCRP